MTDVSKNRIEGSVDEARGKIKEGIGSATDNEQLQGEGKVDQIEGKIKQGVADVKDKVDDLVKNVTDRDKK